MMYYNSIYSEFFNIILYYHKKKRLKIRQKNDTTTVLPR